MSDFILPSEIEFTLPTIVELFSCSESTCDSFIENVFLREFSKTANDGLRIFRQYDCDVGFTTYCLDFLLAFDLNGKKIGVECDGAEFHTVKRDSQRDAAIIRAVIVDEIVRVPGRDIWFRIHDVLQMIWLQEPWLFSERGVTNLNALATRPNRVSDTRPDWRTLVHGIYQVQRRDYGLPRHFEAEHNFDFVAAQNEEGEWWENMPTLLHWAISENASSYHL